MTKLDLLLQVLYKNPGLTRKEIVAHTGFKANLLNMYLTSMYGYLVGRSMGNPRVRWICSADYKPPKGRIIKQYFLTDQGQLRAKRVSNSV